MNTKSYDTLRDKWLAFWDMENHDRPLMSVYAPSEKNDYSTISAPETTKERWFDLDFILKQHRRNMNNTCFYGEAIPFACANLGPDILGAICGCDLIFGEDTSWATHFVVDWDELEPIKFDPQNPWFLKIQEITKMFLDDSNGEYLVGVTDLHPGMDGLVSMRGPEELCMDLYETPESIAPRVNQMFDVYKEVFLAQTRLIQDHQSGATNWMGVWHPDKNWYVSSCDFAALISLDHFDAFVLPGLLKELDFLPASIYHLDGPGALRTLDRLIEIPDLNGIQWVPGAGNATPGGWIPIYKRIQAAGKCIVANCEPSDVKILCEELQPEGLYITCSVASESEAHDIIRMAESICAGKRR